MAKGLKYIIVTASVVWTMLFTASHWKDGIRDPHWGMDVIMYRQAALGDPMWSARTWPEQFTYGYVYSDIHTWAFTPLTWVSQEWAVTIVTILNALLFWYTMIRLSEVPYGTLLALTVGAKIFTWLFSTGNISILSAFLCLWPAGAVVGALVKPYGLGVVAVHALRWTAGSGMEQSLSRRQRAVLTGGVLCAAAVWSWFFWLSEATRQRIIE